MVSQLDQTEYRAPEVVSSWIDSFEEFDWDESVSIAANVMKYGFTKETANMIIEGVNMETLMEDIPLNWAKEHIWRTEIELDPEYQRFLKLLD
jgi:hypothetical protein